MSERDSLPLRCRKAIEALSQREGWALSRAQIDAYFDQIIAIVPVAVLDRLVDQVVIAYHTDHQRVAALRNNDNPQYESAWGWAAREIATATRVNDLAWTRDRSVDLDDLVQIVQTEVVRSISRYHYASSLRTWVHGVTVRRLKRYYRDSLAAKRAGLNVPLEQADEQIAAWSEVAQPMMASLLVAHIRRILDATGDQRYAQIFLMRAVGGMSADEVGARLRLHPSRVRTLLRMARVLLQQDPDLRRWDVDEDDGDDKSE